MSDLPPGMLQVSRWMTRAVQAEKRVATLELEVRSLRIRNTGLLALLQSWADNEARLDAQVAMASALRAQKQIKEDIHSVLAAARESSNNSDEGQQ